MIPQIASYKRPPIVESVLGIEFTEPIQNWGLLHYGIYWQSIREHYPNYSVHPLLADKPTVTISAVPDIPRCWYITKEEDRIIQVQGDRFIVNWRRPQSEQHYPRYGKNREIFQAEWAIFSKMLETEGLKVPQIKACEVSYINQIDEGKGWQTYGDFGRIFKHWNSFDKDDWLPAPELATFSSVFRIEQSGILTCQVTPAINTETGEKSIQFTLTAKSQPKTNETSSILATLDGCREIVVRSFESLTTKQMQEFWGKELLA